jgi:hypothetical protein
MYLPQYVRTMRELGITGPLEVRVGLRRMNHMNIQPDRAIYWDRRTFRPLTQANYVLGPVRITEDMDDAAIREAMRPGFTLVWRDGGSCLSPIRAVLLHRREPLIEHAVPVAETYWGFRKAYMTNKLRVNSLHGGSRLSAH